MKSLIIDHELVRLLLSELFQRLTLEGKAIKMGTPATEADMQELNAEIQSIEALDLSIKI